MSRVRWVGQALGVLALAVGFVAMHAMAGGHGTHAAAVTQLDHASATAPVNVLVEGPASVAEEIAVPCSGGCSPAQGGVLGVCLMVLAAAVVLLLRGANSGHVVTTRHTLVQAAGPGRASRAPPPSLLVLCISRT